MKVPKPTVCKDTAYLKWVRWRPCWVLNQDPMHRCADTIGNGISEASHLSGKSLDCHVLPMCGLAHRTGPKSWHAGQKTFCVYYRTTKAELIREAEALYRTYRENP